MSLEELFGGKWESISCRFLFSTDSNHSVDSTGGEEIHTLTENEMPSHNHGYQRFDYQTYGRVNPGSENIQPCKYNDNYFTTSSTTYYKGGNQPHNNMTPYITAYCWRRYR